MLLTWNLNILNLIRICEIHVLLIFLFSYLFLGKQKEREREKKKTISKMIYISTSSIS